MTTLSTSEGTPANPAVTIVIPAHNAEHALPETLKSVQNQTFRNFEVIIVDDGSTDQTAAIALSFAASDPRFRVIRQPNAGVGAARNTAIREARGTYIAPLDADDLWLPTKLEHQVACMEQHGESAGLVYCWSIWIDDKGTVLGRGDCPRLEGHVRSALILRDFLGNASVPLLRKSVLEQTGLYLTREEQEGAQGCEDWDLNLRVAEVSTVHVVPEHLVSYRQAQTSMSTQTEGMSRSFRLVMQRARERNPDLRRALFHWSTGHFYHYLAKKAYLWRDYGACFRNMLWAISHDLTFLLSTSTYRILLRSLLRWINPSSRIPRPTRSCESGPKAGSEKSEGADRPPKSNPTSPPKTWFSQIHARRWEAVRSGRWDLPKAARIRSRQRTPGGRDRRVNLYLPDAR